METSFNKKNVERLFEKKGLLDNKHKLNTSPIKVSMETLKKIESGVTIEDLDEMQYNGLDIYKYNTQITIHGDFEVLQNNYIGGYMNIFQNKNKSIGVRWGAIDTIKKQDIYEALSVIGYEEYRRSTEWCALLTKRFDKKEDAIKQCIQFNEEIKNINETLFYGSIYVNAFEFWGRYYAEKVVMINGVYQMNINKLIEEIAGMSLSELEEIERKNEEEEKRRRDEIEQEYEKKQIEYDAKMKEFVSNNTPEGFDYKIIDENNCFNHIIAVVSDYSGQFEFEFYRIIKRKRTVFRVKCDINGHFNELDKGFRFRGYGHRRLVKSI